MNTKLQRYYRTNKQRALSELFDFLRIPSISSEPEHTEHVLQAAEFLAKELKRIGMTKVKLFKKKNRHPLVFAERKAYPGYPTVLFYGHYDVQPVNPLNLWISPPFEPTIRQGRIYARGSSDDKGQLWLLVKAVEGYHAVCDGKVGIKFLSEGEEEYTGNHIREFVPAHKELLKADVAYVCDTSQYAPNTPSIVTELRGLVYAEIECVGGKKEVHSGECSFVPDPFIALCKIVAASVDEKRRITIPGFYDQVAEPSESDLASWRSLPQSDAKFIDETGCNAVVCEEGRSVLECLWSRPTFSVHGMPGGYMGDGCKTSIPPKAIAKVSFRIVPNMDTHKIVGTKKVYSSSMKPEEVEGIFPNFVFNLVQSMPGITAEIRILDASPSILINNNNKYAQAIGQAMAEAFRNETVNIGMGGSIEVVDLFQQHVNKNVVVAAFALPSDDIHAPNENYSLGNFYRGIQSVGEFLVLCESQH